MNCHQLTALIFGALIAASPLTKAKDEAVASEPSQQSLPADNPDQLEDKPKDKAKGVTASIKALEGIAEKLKGTQRGYVVEGYLEVLQSLLDGKAADADTIWKTSRKINQHMALIGRPDQCSDDEKEEVIKPEEKSVDKKGAKEAACFAKKVRAITKDLIRASYTDSIHSNKNLSEQIQKRLPMLLEDASKLAEDQSAIKEDIQPFILANRREDFLAELTLFSKRYLSTKRFKPGIGYSYSYIPDFLFSSFSEIDFSSYQQNIDGRLDRTAFFSEFSDASYHSISLIGKMPFLTVSVSLPMLDETYEDQRTVRQRSIAGIPGDTFYQSSIKTQLTMDYDVSIDISFRDLIYAFEDPDKPSKGQADAGIGLGFAGLTVNEEFTTDLRFRPIGDTTAFANLTDQRLVKNSRKNDLVVTYLSAHASFVMTDEFEVGVRGRKFASNGSFSSDDVVISLFINYYPTRFIPKPLRDLFDDEDE